MSRYRAIAGSAAGALLVAAAFVAPALGAPDRQQRLERHDAPTAQRALGVFTPASADPKLAALFARSGLDTSDFSFTPSESRHNNRAVTLAVQGKTTRGTPEAGQLAATSPTVNLAPIAYNLGVSVGWKKFALSGDLAKVDLAGLPGSRESVDLGVSYSTRKFTGRVKAAADRPLSGDVPALVEEAPTYSVDVGGSYSLTRNFDVTAGVRYKSERNRLEQIDEPHHDSQAVYIGTAFRF